MTITTVPKDTSTLAQSPKSLTEIRILTMPQGGLDRLSFVTWDTVEVLGYGEDTFELHGHYAIERAQPTSPNWHDASVDITMRELSLTGVSEKFGRIHVSVNHDSGQRSGGQVKAGTTYAGIFDSPKPCLMYGYMKFELPDIGVVVFNKEAIELQHNITHIPPVGQGGGTRGRVAVSLYRLDDPDGPPVAVLREVRTHIGAWLDD